MGPSLYAFSPSRDLQARFWAICMRLPQVSSNTATVASPVFVGFNVNVMHAGIDIDLVRELMNESTKMTWEKVKPMVEDARKQIAQRKSGEYIPVYQWWEYLYNELKKREQTLQAQQ